MVQTPESIAYRLSGPFSSYGTRISKVGMSSEEIRDARKFCSDLGAEVKRLEQEVEQARIRLSKARQLCHHEGDQGEDCVHCGEQCESQFD